MNRAIDNLITLIEKDLDDIYTALEKEDLAKAGDALHSAQVICKVLKDEVTIWH